MASTVVYLPIIPVYLSTYVFISIYIYVSIYLYMYVLCAYLAIHHLFIYLSRDLCYLSTYLSTYLWIYLFIY